MAIAKFKAGERVSVHAPILVPAQTVFQVVRQMPDDKSEPYYRVRSLIDGHERMVAEHQLRHVGP